MLQHLLIKDLAIVAFVDLHFFEGMTVITGETGAGKSILLDALGLLLGDRADSQLIRPGAERAEMTATFDISSLPGAILWLADLALTGDTEKCCIIRRVIYANGRSRAFINGIPVTTQQLRFLGEYLVQIHGQHQQQLLLKSGEQLRLLDAFGQHDAIVSQVKTTFKEWETLQRRKQHLQQSREHAESQNDLLQYQMAELENLNLAERELTTLYQEHDQLANAKEIIEASEYAKTLLESNENTNALQLITKATHTLRPLLKVKALANANECLDNARIQLEEAILELQGFLNHSEINPHRLEAVEQRLSAIHEIARKHKVEPLKLFDHQNQLKQKAKQFSLFEEKIAQIDQDLQLAEKQYQRFAQKLTHARQIASQKLAKEVTTTIQQLGMPGALFTAELIPQTENTLHLTGNETMLFGISANPGHPPQPLHKVASGGELSRVSLAIELMTAKYLATPCLIFDEVDVGISGKIGALVGKALYDLGNCAQVICITHLPQVAAFGHHHIQVTKLRTENTTVTEIAMLDQAQRVNEIARMLGGIDVTSQALAHANELLNHHAKQETEEIA